MDNQIKTSFIPRKPLQSSNDIQKAGFHQDSHTSAGAAVFSLVATVIFLVACIAFGGTFLWQKQLDGKITQQQADMKRSLEGFDERFIKEATRLDTRIKEAQNVLENHVSPSTLYALLSQRTLQTISFSKFTLQDAKDGTLRLSGEGEALRYESIVLQSDEFGRSGYLRNVLFSNLKVNDTNEQVQFSFEARLDPRLILYRDRQSVINSPTQ